MATRIAHLSETFPQFPAGRGFRAAKLAWLNLFFLFLLSSPAFATSVPGYGDYLSRIPDNSGVRQRVADLISAPISELLKVRPRVYTQVIEPMAVRFAVEQDRALGLTYLTFQNAVSGKFAQASAGDVAIWRSTRDGSIRQIKAFITSSPGIYIRVEDNGSTSLMSVFFERDASPIYRDVRIPVPISQVALMPVTDIIKATDARVVWRVLLDRPDSSLYVDDLSMMKVIRGGLSTLPDADDGAMDENGNLVKISSETATGLPGFNCSGFAKWVADGLIYPLTGKYLKIDDLKERLLDYRGDDTTIPFEESRDPFFGLDWTRNIARIVGPLQSPSSSGAVEAWDVRAVPFMNYTEDKGYTVAKLRLALYLLALKEPGNFYLGAVNGEWGSSPVLWQYYHIVVLFPYIDGNGAFRCAVFERNVETSLESLERRYATKPGQKDTFVHLVRLKASGDFNPPRIK